MDATFDLRYARRGGAPSSPSSATEPRRVDGRRLRSERTRQSIIDAFLLLLREIPSPDAHGGADRRARGLFGALDIPALSRSSGAPCRGGRPRHHALSANCAACNVDADRAMRIRDQVQTRAGVCEEWLPLYRALAMDRSESVELELRIRRARAATWKRLELMYWPELSGLSSTDRQELLITLEALTDYASWARMRGPHGAVDRGRFRDLDPCHRSPAAADALGFLTLRPSQRRKAPLRWTNPRWRP